MRAPCTKRSAPMKRSVIGAMASMVLGEQIDLRIFPSSWAFGFAVEKTNDDGTVRRSLQFFDAQGDAVHKVHSAPGHQSGRLGHAGGKPALGRPVRRYRRSSPSPRRPRLGEPASIEHCATAGAAMTDTHQFFGMLKALNLPRLTGARNGGRGLCLAARSRRRRAPLRRMPPRRPGPADHGLRRQSRLHPDPFRPGHQHQDHGPWLNVLDDTFHLHLRLDHIAAVWAVRKPTSDGHVTSVEVYDENGELIIQFFGKRQEGTDERADWRNLVETLPRSSKPTRLGAPHASFIPCGRSRRCHAYAFAPSRRFRPRTSSPSPIPRAWSRSAAR